MIIPRSRIYKSAGPILSNLCVLPSRIQTEITNFPNTILCLWILFGPAFHCGYGPWLRLLYVGFPFLTFHAEKSLSVVPGPCHIKQPVAPQKYHHTPDWRNFWPLFLDPIFSTFAVPTAQFCILKYLWIYFKYPCNCDSKYLCLYFTHL